MVCVIALGIIIWGLYNIVNKIRKKYTVVLNYNLLHDFLTVARCEAENTIINIGGDLSWLDKDLESLREIKNEHSNIKIRIYYDKKSLSLNTKLLVSKIRKEKIVELIPYPESITPPSMEYGNIIEKEQNKFDLIFKVKRKYENTNESTTWVSINERKRVSALYKEQEYNFIPKYSEIYEIGSETFVDDVTVAAEKMAQKIYDYYYM